MTESKERIADIKIAGCTVGPSIPMIGPVKDGGTLVVHTAPGCWGPMITPSLDGGHEISEPVAVEGAVVGDAIAIRIERIAVTSLASASGTDAPVKGTRARKGERVVRVCPGCGVEFPPTTLHEPGPDAIRCAECGTMAMPYRMTCGYTMVLDEAHGLGMTVGDQGAQQIAQQVEEMAALPESAGQHSVLMLANSDLGGGILARMRPFVGNLGTTPSMDVSASGNCGDFGQGLREGGLTPELFDRLTDGHLDADSVREGAILICPVKVDGGGVYVGDVHAMQGDGEIAGHTTDVSAEVTLKVEVIKGLGMQGPILLPPVEDLPFLARPYDGQELAHGQRLAGQWHTSLEALAPIQVIGSGPNLNAATQNALERTAQLLDMTVDEVRNRVTITGGVEIGRAPGLVLVSIMAPVDRLKSLGIWHLVRAQYGLPEA